MRKIIFLLMTSFLMLSCGDSTSRNSNGGDMDNEKVMDSDVTSFNLQTSSVDEVPISYDVIIDNTMPESDQTELENFLKHETTSKEALNMYTDRGYLSVIWHLFDGVIDVRVKFDNRFINNYNEFEEIEESLENTQESYHKMLNQVDNGEDVNEDLEEVKRRLDSLVKERNELKESLTDLSND